MAPLKFGSSSKTSTFKRSAFPMQSGTVGHASALKAVEQTKEQSADELAKMKLEEEKRKIRDAEKAREEAEQKKKEAEEKEKQDKEYRKTRKTQKLEEKIKEHKGGKKGKKAYKEYKKKQQEAQGTYEEYKKEMGEGEGVLSEKEWKKQNEGNIMSRKDWVASDEGQESLKDIRTKKGDRLKEKLAESKMYDDMTIEQRMDYKAKKRDARDKRIRNTIATIDDIIPSQFGGGRGTAKRQNTELTDQPSFSEGGKGTPIEPTKGGDQEEETTGTLTEQLNEETAVEENTTPTNKEENKQQEIEESDNVSEDNTNIDESDQTDEKESSGSDIPWDEAPALNTQERKDWYKKYNLAQDHTTTLK